MTFNADKHVIELQGKAYLEVKWRLVWFRQECPNGTIDTEEVQVDIDREVEAEVPTGNWIANPNRPGKKMPEKIVKRDKGYARFKAVVTDGKGGRATGTKSENAASFPDYIEKAETGAIGRALALLGYGTQFTGDELNEEHRIVDAPVDRANPGYSGRETVEGVTNDLHANNGTPSATEQQLASLRKLNQHLGKPEQDTKDMTYQAAKDAIMALSKEYNEMRMARKPA
jgi:hypothetical protein